ncbi:MAG: hypothetical protein E6Q50_02280 [Lysobacter sp.]|nr:MAG: hypothetical protein E6Q50_02280 [Lysobacter sp.]
MFSAAFDCGFADFGARVSQKIAANAMASTASTMTVETVSFALSTINAGAMAAMAISHLKPSAKAGFSNMPVARRIAATRIASNAAGTRNRQTMNPQAPFS